MEDLDFSKSLLFLAPLAGYTDLPFRYIAKKFGADLTISEMISSNALVHNSKKTLKMLEKSSNEDPYFVQLSGNDEAIIKDAVEILNERDGIAGIDLNCGCPAPKVFNHGSGSSLLNDLKKLEKILSTIKLNSKKKYTSAKIRIGVVEKKPIEISKVVEACGVDFICVHGRTRAGGYKSEVDYGAIKDIKSSVKVPIIANGDIKDLAKAKEVLEFTKANGLMIGRGAIGKPWIFHQIKNNEEEISPLLKAQIVQEHFSKMLEFYGDYGVVLFRKHLHTYSKGLNGANEFRQKINKISEPLKVKKLLEDFFIF